VDSDDLDALMELFVDDVKATQGQRGRGSFPDGWPSWQTFHATTRDR
jgi:hypothetical protein